MKPFNPFVFSSHWSWIEEDVKMVLSTVCQSVCPSHYWGFPYIYRQIADQIELKFSGWTHYRTLRPDQVLVMLCWIPTVSWPLVEEFLDICWQSADQIAEFVGWTRYMYGTPLAWLNFGTLHWIPAVSWLLIGWADSAHLQTNHWWDWTQIWRMTSHYLSKYWQRSVMSYMAYLGHK